jgi:hypothetical protein
MKLEIGEHIIQIQTDSVQDYVGCLALTNKGRVIYKGNILGDREWQECKLPEYNTNPGINL